MNYLLRRVFVGVMIAIIMMGVHKVSRADSYTAVTGYYYPGPIYPTPVQYSWTVPAACLVINNYYGSGYYVIQKDLTNTCRRFVEPARTSYFDFVLTTSLQCPGGGTLSSNTCISAPACISPNIRATGGSINGQCFIPNECAFPENDIGAGCDYHPCATGQNRNPLTNICQSPPTCNSYQLYLINSNTCVINCPIHSHASSNQTQCLPDVPLACSIGMHDDGTYNCVADDAVACTGNTQSGTINGIPQCIPRPNLDTAQQAAADAAVAAQTKANSVDSAAAAKQAADAALAADPTNTTKQASDLLAQNNLNKAISDLNTANTVASNASNIAGNGLLNSINQNGIAANGVLGTVSGYLKGLYDNMTGETVSVSNAAGQGVGMFGTAGTADSTHNTIVDVSSVSISGDSGSGSCPSPETFTTSLGSFNLSYQSLCDLAADIKPIFLGMAYIFAAFIAISGVI
jgi:hypothetical protein